MGVMWCYVMHMVQYDDCQYNFNARDGDNERDLLQRVARESLVV